ncbi:conserved exported protein of unknown function [Methanocaldococcus lauensis]|nr:conserved exported protein of unknown function [Methanocaldococcus lauensis]
MGCKKVFYYFLISMLFLFISQIYADDWNPPETYSFNIIGGHKYYVNYTAINLSNNKIFSTGYSYIYTNVYKIGNTTHISVYFRSHGTNASTCQRIRYHNGVFQYIVSISNSSYFYINLTKPPTENKTYINVLSKRGVRIIISAKDLTTNQTIPLSLPNNTTNSTTNTAGNTKAPIPFEVVILVLIAIPLISLKKFK